MPSTDWGQERGGPNFQAWDEFYWIVAQRICQQHAHEEDGPAEYHLKNPAANNAPCEWCYGEAWNLLELCMGDLLMVYGSVAYACGRDGISKDEADRRALNAMLERAREMERATELLAEMDGSGWWRLPLEDDERQL